MNVGNLRNLIADLPDDTEIWEWNDKSDYWGRLTSFRVGLQNPKHKEVIFLSEEHYEDGKNEMFEEFRIPTNKMKKVIIAG